MATVKLPSTAPVREPADRWTTAEASELYDVARWGKGYFSVASNGHVWVHPNKDLNRWPRSERAGGQSPTCAASPCPILDPVPEKFSRTVWEKSIRRFKPRSPSMAMHGTTAASTRLRSTSSGRLSKRFFEYGRPYKFGLEAGSKPGTAGGFSDRR